jgi:hypothetical protein
MHGVAGNLAAEETEFPKSPIRVVTSFNQYLAKGLGLRLHWPA